MGDYLLNVRKQHLNISLQIISLFLIFVSVFFLVISKIKFNFILIVILTLIYLIFLSKVLIDNKIKYLAFTFFILKILLLSTYSKFNSIILFPDSVNYLKNLDVILLSGDYSIENIKAVTGTLHVGHYYFMLIPYSIFKTPESIMYTNALVVSISTVLFYKVFDQEFGGKVALFTFILSSISLNLGIFGSFILKDSSVLFLGALIIYFMKVRKFRYVAIFLSLVLFTVRIYAGFAFLLAIFFEMVYLKRKSNGRIFNLVGLLGASLIIFFVIKIPIALAYFNMSVNYMLEMLDPLIIFNTITSLFKFYFSPFPWNVISNYDVYTILLFDSTIFIILSVSILLFVLKFIKYKALRIKTWIYIIPILIHAIVLGYEYGGDSTRQRIGVFVFLILICGLGFYYDDKTNKNVEKL